nr:MAG: hypothetical protein [Lake Baikal virophage 11]
MALEVLADPLSALRYLPRGMNYATAEEVGINNPYWALSHQYVKNDVCLSGINEGAYVFLGGVTNKTSQKGGLDPSLDSDWVSLAPVGVNSLVAAVPVAAGAAAPAYTMTVNSLAVPASTVWCVTWQCTATKATALVAADFIAWTLTAGANTATICQVPIVDAVTTSSTCANSVVISVPAATTSIVLTGSTASGNTSAVLTVSNTRLTAVRLS